MVKTKKSISRRQKIKEKIIYQRRKERFRKHIPSLMSVVLLIAAIYIGISLSGPKPVPSPAANMKVPPVLLQSVIDDFSTPSAELLTIKPTQKPDLTPTPSASPSGIPSVTPYDMGYCLYVPVFMYHHIAPASLAQANNFTSLNVDNGWFDQQLSYLNTNGYTSLTATQLVNAIISHQSLPAKSYVLTIDDGYDDIYTYAYPILQKYHVIANLMIPSGLIDNHGYLSWDQLKEMQGSGIVQIYNHTWSHSPLGQDTKDKILFEMTTSQEQFTSYLHITPDIMAYPYGSNSPLAVQILKQLGFVAAFTTVPGENECSGNLLTLPRVRIGNTSMASYGY